MITFLPETVYGSRSGYQEVLLCVANERLHPVLKSKFFKTGHVSGANMLQRADMMKLPKDYGTEGRFTQVQELKQARYIAFTGVMCLSWS